MVPVGATCSTSAEHLHDRRALPDDAAATVQQLVLAHEIGVLELELSSKSLNLGQGILQLLLGGLPLGHIDRRAEKALRSDRGGLLNPAD